MMLERLVSNFSVCNVRNETMSEDEDIGCAQPQIISRCDMFVNRSIITNHVRS